MQESLTDVLALFSQPAFLVRDDVVTWCNAAARTMIVEGVSLSGWMDMRLFSLWSRKGTFQTSLYLNDQVYDATVRETPDGFLFVAAKSDECTDATADALLCASAALRAPMQTMLGAAHTIFARADEDAPLDLAAAQLNQSIYRLLRLCGQMSDGGQLLLHRRAAHREPTNVPDFFAYFVRDAAPLVETRGVKIRLKSSVAPNLVADIDRDLIMRAMYNLVANSLSYTPEGGEIVVSLELLERQLLVTVTDNGAGISKAVSANLFRRFEVRFGGDPRWGLGLGLPMVREIVRLHEGNLTLSDNPDGNGTVVTFTLALTPAVLDLRSRTLRYDYCGDFHTGLVELSNVLAAEVYDPEEVM